MIRLSSHRLLTGLSLAGVLAVTAACSGPASMTPTGPTAVVNNASAATAVNFSPNPDSTTPEDPPASLKGRFTGGGFQMVGEIKITRGFTIHCDNLLTNNLEINWPGGNNFHMEKNTLTTVVCSKPVIPNPPDSDVSRIEASAEGTCNNVPALITFVLEDRGEPGTNDRAAFNITGGCALTVAEAFLDGGNIQAHFDQPHKR